MYEKRKTLEDFLILIIDILSLSVSFVLADWNCYRKMLGQSINWDPIWFWESMVILYIPLYFFLDFKYHFFRRKMTEELISVARIDFFFMLSWIGLLYVMQRSSGISRRMLGYLSVINLPVMFSMRVAFKQYMLRVFHTGRYSSRILVVTTSERVDSVLKNMTFYHEWYRQIVGIVLTDGGTQKVVGEVAVVADGGSMIDYVIHNVVDEVFIINGMDKDDSQLELWVKTMQQMGITVNVNIDIFDIMNSGKKDLDRVGNYAVVTFARNLYSAEQMMAKRLLDIAGSLMGMLLLGVTTVFVAPAIKIDSPGPVIFRQTRVGKNGRKFTLYKFRSMYREAEQRKQELMAFNEVDGLMFKMKDDPRITKVGRFIRRTSIDEFPQFWNVLKGDMSLVGTRPPTVDEFEQYEARHKCRLSMKPGLTGLWQISGRNDISNFEEIVKLDMQYIDHWSIWRDIKIIFLTIWVVISGRGSK